MRGRNLLIAGMFTGTAIAVLATAASAQTTAQTTTTQVTTPAATTDAQKDDSQGTGLDIVVTARRQNERLLDVPINVTAVSNEQLAQRNVNDLFDLMRNVPSLSYGDTGLRNANKLTVRGLGVSTTGSSKASVFLDGVYIAGNYTGLSLAGLDRVEVLKGPQSALFGRSTFGGAVNYVTHAPGNQMEGALNVDVATLGEHNVNGYVSAPIIEDKLYGFISGSYNQFNGPLAWTNVRNNTPVGKQSGQAFLGKLVFTPTSQLTIRALASYHSIDDSLGNGLFIDPAARNGVIQKIDPVTGAPTGKTAQYPVGGIPFFKPVYGSYNVFTDYLPDVGTRIQDWRTYLQTEWVSDGGTTLTLTGAVNREKSDAQGNIYLRSRPPSGYVANTVSETRTNDESLELRVSSPQDKPIRVAVGAYYLNLRAISLPSTYAIYVASTAAGDLISPKGGNSETRTLDKSIFGAAYWDITQNLHLSLEGRYQWENVRTTALNPTIMLLSSYNAGVAPTYTQLLNPQGGIYQRTFGAFLPRVNVQYDLTRDMNVYATYSIGTNPGGFNTSQFATVAQQVINEEKLYNYEIGFKGRITRSLSVEIAAYHMDWKNQQTTGTFYTPSNLIYSLITNQGSSKVNGAEASVNWQPLTSLTLGGTVSYNNGKYDKFCSANYAALTYDYTAPSYLALTPAQRTKYACRAVDGNALESISKWQATANFYYTAPVSGDWKAFIRGDYSYMGPQWDSELNLAQLRAANVINAGIGIRNEHWSIEAYARNLTDDDTPVRITRASDSFAGANNTVNQSIAFIPRRPRQFGVKAGVRF